ncbi:hypothetical protein KY285_020526 [Solanum tuberosum]|nr:hypothetical protein KY285_020526 [Solanum tuberosum]
MEGKKTKCRQCDVDIGIMMVSPAVKPRYCLDTIIARNKVNQLKNRLEELDVVEDARIAQTTFYDQMAEVGQKGWWESTEQLNADEVTIFEAWLSDTCSKMPHHSNQLENGAPSSLGR